MKKQIHPILIILFIFLIFRAGPLSAQQEKTNYNNDLLMAILWQQNSGEYAALCYQAFNAGKNYILSLSAENKKAVVFDIDETILDNSKYAAWMVKTGNSWSADSWEDWCNAVQADAVPGALDFAFFIEKKGIEIFYISNRPETAAAGTIANLKKLGFPLADSKHVFLMKNSSDKNPRIESIKSMGYEIVLFAGDNLDDFDSSIRKWNNKERKIWTDNYMEEFGAYYIILPNSVYGSFESAIKPDYYSLPPDEKARARLEIIDDWKK